MPKRISRMCFDYRTDCFAYGAYGKCKACVDTGFIGDCPFYKPADVRKEEHKAAIKKLETMGRKDLIDKYGREGCEEPSVWNEI